MVITFITDFGMKDPYVGMMKGAILKLNSSVQFIDITNEIPPHDICKAGFFLSEIMPYFSEGTIHLCVVDPGVGSLRKILLADINNQFVIFPDNGLISRSVKKYGIRTLYEINKEFFNDVSSTFHGRDIFAPVAGRLASSCNHEELQFLNKIKTDDLILNPASDLDRSQNNVTGKFLYADVFGNMIFDIRKADIDDNFIHSEILYIDVVGLKIEDFKLSYHEGQKGELIALWNSLGYLEIACVEGNAFEKITGSGRELICTIKLNN